jgi:hypothetical protein
MKEPSLKQILLDHINSTEGWMSKGSLAVVAENEGFLGESAGRVLRDLESEGKIQVSYYKSKRNIDLARYARIGEAEPIPPKVRLIEVVKDGVPTMIYA